MVAVDELRLDSGDDLSSEGPGQQVPELSKLLEQGGPECHISETLESSTSSMKHGPGRMATGGKLQAASKKLQAPSVKRQAPIASSHKL